MKHINLLIIILATCLFCSCRQEKKADNNLIPVKTNQDGWIFINQKGETVLKPVQKIYKASFFYDGISLIEIADEMSQTLSSPLTFLNINGELINNKKYKYATIFNDGIAWCVEENGYPTAINQKGETLFSLKNSEKAGIFSEGLAAVCFKEDGIETWGYVNNKGEIVIPPTFVACDLFSEGMASATIDEKVGYGYINKKGEFVIQPQFSATYMFNGDGLAVVAIGDSDRKYGVIDKSGKYVISPQYDRIVPDGDLFIVESSGVYGWVDSQGKTVINPQLKGLGPFNGFNIAPASIDGSKFGLIDKKGTYILNPQYVSICSFIGNIAPFSMSGKYGFIDKEGKIVINPQYTDIAIDYMMWAVGYDYTKLLSVETDYCDIESICKNFVINSNKDTFRGIGNNTTFASIKNQYNNLSYNSATSRKFDDPIDLGNGVSIKDVVFWFSTELSKSSYNYYERKYETIEANDAKVESIGYALSIDQYSRAKNKGKSIANEIAKAIKNTCGMTILTEKNKGGTQVEITLESSEMNISITGSESRIAIIISFDK